MSDLLNQASLVYIPSGYKEDTAYSVIPTDGSGDLTFTRASDGTRINSAGLVENVPWNLLQYSNDFSNVVWTKNNATLTSGQSDPFGGTNAWKFEAIISAQADFRQTVTGANSYSFYAKAGTSPDFRLWSGTSGTIFNLSTGTISSGSGIIESVGNGWYRCTILTSTSASVTLIPYFVGNAGDYIYVAFGQAQATTTAKPYFPTTDRQNVPRLSYEGGCPSLLLEPQRTNYAPNSEQLTSWTTYGVGTITEVANAAISPDGYQNADEFTVTRATSSNSIFKYKITSTLPVGSMTNSIWLKAKTSGDIGEKICIWSFQSGNKGIYVATLTADWVRHSTPSWTATANTTEVEFGLLNGYATDTLSVSFYAWGYQCENGAYATSYIPTTSAAVTRVADAAYNLSASSLIGTTEGVVFIDIQTPSTIGANSTFSIGGGTSGEYAQLEIRTDLSINWRYRVGGTDYINANVGSFTAGDRLKIAFAYKNLDSILYLNGSSIATDTGTTATNAWNEIRFSNFAGTGKLEARVNQALLFKTRLTNDQLAALTTL